MTNTLIVVVRYFGGTLLGVAGLINAYKNAAADAILNAEIIEKSIDSVFEITFTYKDLNDVMQIIKNENLNQIKTELYEFCLINFSVRKSESKRIKSLFESFYGVSIKQVI